MFSETVQSILEKSGWSPDRSVPVGHWVRMLESQGFTMLPDAVKILETFSGLKIEPPKVEGDTCLKGFLLFDIIMAASGEYDRVEYWEKQLDMKLSPIAIGSKQEMILIAEDDRIFACANGDLYFVGNSFEDAMENTFIVAKRRYVKFGEIRD